jgi:hypothetical protein
MKLELLSKGAEEIFDLREVNTEADRPKINKLEIPLFKINNQ